MPVEGRGLSSRQRKTRCGTWRLGNLATPKSVQQLQTAFHAKRRDVLSESRMRGALGEAGMSLPVQVWSVQSRASRTGASLAGVVATRGPKRRQQSYGV